jgi:hypothetical protein
MPRSFRSSWGALHLVTVIPLIAFAAIITAPAALAHGDETTASAREAVLQAIAYIVNDPGNMGAISDKVGDSLEAEDMSGMDVALVKKAQVAIGGNQMMRARTLLERAIGARSDMAGTDMQPILQVPRGSSSLTLAVGTATGTNVVTDELPGRRSLTGADIALLVLAALMALTGVLLSFRLRPPDSVRTLRRQAKTTGRA